MSAYKISTERESCFGGVRLSVLREEEELGLSASVSLRKQIQHEELDRLVRI